MSEQAEAKIYLTHFPVQSFLEADALSKESTWTILENIRKAGARGVSADEISKALNLPSSVVYSTLKELRRLEFVFVYPREKKRRNERKKRYVCERATWGKYGINPDFLTALKLEGEVYKTNEKLTPILLEVLGNVYEDFEKKTQLKMFLPRAREENICPKCDRSHEAMEFFYAILLKAMDSFITESDEFRHFLTQRGFSR
ncbi:MAG: winged helix DNA-binding protein [Nitrososphaerales archaeon]|nr:winged helix DNA-binding protein [Nitrososphaerales archaeon]